jgi:Zn finger protein HypA/HybF involved in hydrogenase expression
MEYDRNKTNSWKKSGIKPKDIPKAEFIEVCNKHKTMARAAAELGLHFGTFRVYAKKYNCYRINQSGKGINKNIPKRVIKLEDLATRTSVRGRVLKEKLLEYECNTCSVKDYNGKPLSLELDHINGNRHDHRLENLRWLCPNCHSQTPTFRNKKRMPS